MIFAWCKWRCRVACEPATPARNSSISNGLLMLPTDIGSDHIDPTVPQLIADFLSGITIKVPIYLVASTAIDRRSVLGNPLIALTCVSSSQFMKTFKVVCMENVPRGADDVLQNVQKAFIWCNQVSATHWRNLRRKSKRIANMLIYRNPARR